jgi:hypothetical protein
MGYSSSCLAYRIGHLDPIGQPYIGFGERARLPKCIGCTWSYLHAEQDIWSLYGSHAEDPHSHNPNSAANNALPSSIYVLVYLSAEAWADVVRDWLKVLCLSACLSFRIGVGGRRPRLA